MRTNKVNFISDKKIISWNDRLKDTNYTLRPLYTHRSSFPGITIWTLANTPEQTIDHHINYKFSFSVSSNRTEQFFDILNRVLKIPFDTYIIYKDEDYIIDLTGNNTSSVVSEKKEEEHKLLEKSYTRYSYFFSGRLSHIIAYISCIEDTISYFEKIWGYDEDGKEINLLKYPIGSIVSTTKDKSKDYLVLDYNYEKDTNDNFFIDYNCCEILNTNSPVIQYGESKVYYEDELCFSRNNRIDDILN